MKNNHDGALAVAAAEPSAIREEITEIARMVQHALREEEERAVREGRPRSKAVTADLQFLKDLQRGDMRYKATWLVRLVGLSARCAKDSVAFALGEKLNGFVAIRRPRRHLTLVQAVCERSKEQAEADVAIVHAAVAQNDLGALRHAESELIDQRGAVDHAIDAIRARRLTLEGALT